MMNVWRVSDENGEMSMSSALESFDVFLFDKCSEETHKTYRSNLKKELFQAELLENDDIDGIIAQAHDALEVYKKAAADHCVCAMRRLAEIYNSGLSGVVIIEPYLPIDQNLALFWAKKSLSYFYDCYGDLQNPSDGLRILGKIYEVASPVQDLSKAAACYKEAALECGNYFALEAYGDCLFHGRGVPQDQNAGREMIRQSAEMCPSLPSYSAERLRRQYSIDIIPDDSNEKVQERKERRQAFEKKWDALKLKRLVDFGQRGDPHSQTLLAKYYQYGDGAKTVPDHHERAIYWYERLNPDISANDGALCFDIAFAYHQKKENVKAVPWFEKAGHLGIGRSYAYLGVIFYFGSHLEKDIQRAASYFEKGVEQDDPACKVMLGKMLMEGEGVLQDYARGKALSDEGAVQPGSDKYFGLICLESGIEIDKNKALIQ